MGEADLTASDGNPDCTSTSVWLGVANSRGAGEGTRVDGSVAARCKEEPAEVGAVPGPCRSRDSGGRRPPRRRRGAMTCRLSSFRSVLLERRESAASENDEDSDGTGSAMEYHNCDEVAFAAGSSLTGAGGTPKEDLRRDIHALKSNGRGGPASMVVELSPDLAFSTDMERRAASLDDSSRAPSSCRALLRMAERRRVVKEAKSLRSTGCER